MASIASLISSAASAAPLLSPGEYPLLASVMAADAAAHGGRLPLLALPENPGILLGADMDALSLASPTTAAAADQPPAAGAPLATFDSRSVVNALPWWGHVPAADVHASIAAFYEGHAVAAAPGQLLSTPASHDVQQQQRVLAPLDLAGLSRHASTDDYITPPTAGHADDMLHSAMLDSTTPVELIEAATMALLGHVASPPPLPQQQHQHQQHMSASLPSAAHRSSATGVWRTTATTATHAAYPMQHVSRRFTLANPSFGSADNSRRLHLCLWAGCEQRATPFATAQALTDHVAERHLPRRQPEYRCAWAGCKRAAHGFRQRDKMIVHVRLHTDVARYRCRVEDCGREFSRVDSFEDHQKVHAASGRNCRCTVPGCARAYFHAKSLRKHERMAHGLP
jgi:hypothetical protein